MAEIRERSPSELRTERKLVDPLYAEYSPEARNQPLYSFFREKAKDMISYHLDKKKINYVPQKENSKPTNSTPPKSSKKQKRSKKPKLQQPEFHEAPSEILRVKDLLSKRSYILESAANQMKHLKKSLNTLKLTTSRDHLLQEAGEMDESIDQLQRDLESSLLSLHDTMRQVEKLGQVTAFEKTEIRKEFQEELQSALEIQKQKYENKLVALQEQNQKLSKQLKTRVSESELQDKVSIVEQKHAKVLEEAKKKEETITSLRKESQGLNSSLSGKQQEIEKLYREIDNLNTFIKNQEEDYEDSLQNLNAEIKNLSQKVQEQNHELSFLRQAEYQNTQDFSKDNEIKRLRSEVNQLEEAIEGQRRKARLNEDARQREIFELREELDRLRYQKESHSSQDQVFSLRKALEEKERQIELQKERFETELESKEKHRIKQKNEWAEIYTNLKHEIKELKKKVSEMTEENERILNHAERNYRDSMDGKISLKSQNDNLKQKVKEKDQEIKLLWEVLSELQRTYQNKGKIDFNDVRTLLVIKNLEDKARAKLK